MVQSCLPRCLQCSLTPTAHCLPPPHGHTHTRRYLGNIAANPGEDKFRSIRLANAAFQSRVGVLPGAIDFLLTCGFEVGGGVARL